jgi:hypothetical protein
LKEENKTGRFAGYIDGAKEGLRKVLCGPPEIHMEILCGSVLSLTAMSAAGARSMRNSRSVDIIVGGHGGSKRAGRADEMGSDFWQEVSSRYSRENPVPMNPANKQGRVLFEIFLILAAAGALVAAVYVLLPGATLP